VQESIGFTKERGDSVKVINAPFKVTALDKTELPLWKQPETVDLLRASLVPGGLALVALLVFFGMVRPAMRTALAPPPTAAAAPGASLNAVVDDEQSLPGADVPALEGPSNAELLNDARALAKENPQAVAGIVRGWVNGEAA
jgi:flagellar M-ring protein FliF